MKGDLVTRIQSNPKYHQLVQRRKTFSYILTFVMLAIYFGFILTIAFAPQVLAAKLGAGVMTVGIPVGIAVIVSAFVLTGIYVLRANAEYDRLVQEIVKETA